MKIIIACFLMLLAVACDSVEYSPYVIYDRDTPKDLNLKNLQKLSESVANDDTVTIAFTGDSQRFYDNVDKFVDKVNQIPEVDFIILAGDISDFGVLNEFEWVFRSFSKLTRPYLGVLGNHDIVANGEHVFTRMFGPADYSFVYDSIKFVVHNTNGREYPDKKVPSIDWLANEFNSELNPEAKYFIGVSHVPPFDADFQQDQVAPYTELLRDTPGFLLSLHGHIHEHTDGYPFNDGVRYITAFAYNKPSFVLLKIKGTYISKTIINY